MGSYFNFKNFGEMPQQEGNGTKTIGDFPLARQSSIYSLTFDEFQNTWGGPGKDFGSLNMDELLKNIWTAEETQATASSNGARQGGAPNGNLQRQGSLTLPRTLSQKTVDEVWRNLIRESNGGNDGSGNGGSHLHQRQPTLGEMTLEEFLAKAGVVREDAQPMTRPNNNGFYSELPQPNNNTNGLTLGFQQLAQNNVVPNPSSGLPLNVGGVRSSQQQLQPPQPNPIFSKQTIMDFASPMPLTKNSQLASMGTRGAPIVREDPSIDAGFVQGNVIRNGAVGMNGLGTGTTVVGAGSPASKLSSYGIAKSNVDTSSISPSPYTFNEGVRGRKCGGTLEKAAERRHRRMIKNRESAARSRARKQAYTLELEAEIAKLKEVKEELQKKQEEIMEMRKNQILATMNMPWGSKRLCLRRTLTGPW